METGDWFFNCSVRPSPQRTRFLLTHMDIIDLAIVNPGGNVTAVVFDEVPVSQRLEVNNAILAGHSLVEQVLFVERHENSIHGQMAGGEFCGNAARSLGYILAEGRISQQNFTVSGLTVSVFVEAGVNRAKLLVDLCIQHEMRPYKNTIAPVVHLDGISHVVLLSSDPLYAQFYAKALEGKSSLCSVFGELGLLNYPACGLLFVEEKEELKLTPYVYVRAINTLYAETACASGSIAVTSLLGKETKLIQPSKKTLSTKLTPKGDRFRAEVDGYAALLWRGAFSA